MKRIFIFVGIGIFVILFMINILAVSVFYKQYTEKINSIDQQNWLFKIKLENLEKLSEGFKESNENLGNQIKSIETNVTSLVNSGEANTKALETRIQEAKGSFEDWQKKFASLLSQLALVMQKTDGLSEDVEKLKKDVQSTIDLGKIDVEGRTGVVIPAEKTSKR